MQDNIHSQAPGTTASGDHKQAEDLDALRQEMLELQSLQDMYEREEALIAMLRDFELKRMYG